MTSHVRKPKSDRQLADLAREYRMTRAQAKVEAEHADEIKAEILAELDRRGVSVVELSGLTITRRVRAVRRVDLVALAKVIGRSLFARVTKPALDTDRWNAAITSGLVKPADVAAVETEVESAAWLDISEAA